MDTTTSTPLTAVGTYRAALYACFTRARDALFDLCDALATHPDARSFVELSQAPCFQRQWPSVYEALEDGHIDRAALRALFKTTVPHPAPGTRTVLALDSSPSPEGTPAPVRAHGSGPYVGACTGCRPGAAAAHGAGAPRLDLLHAGRRAPGAE